MPSSAGRIALAGRDTTSASPDAIRRSGPVRLPEGRRVLPGLTVHEVLRHHLGEAATT